MKIAARVAEAICPTDYLAWAREFDSTISVSLPEGICSGADTCLLLLEAR